MKRNAVRLRGNVRSAGLRIWEIDHMISVVIRVALAAVLGMAASAASAQTLNTIKSRGVLNCGSNGTLAGC